MYGDELYCRNCKHIFYEDSPDWQDAESFCPYCYYRRYKNLDKKSRKNKLVKRKQNNALFGICPIGIVWNKQYKEWINIYIPKWIGV